MRILLAIDDSKSSQEAVRKLIAQARTRGNQVRVLNVVESIGAYISAGLIPHVVSEAPQIEEDRLRQAKDLVRRVARQLREAGFKTSEAVEKGEPKSLIIDHANHWNADLIVLGSHGWKGLNRFLLGSVSEAVVRHAGCSVQVVRIRAARSRKK
jgi:nucleotide-binding universal stress UspA family protein